MESKGTTYFSTSNHIFRLLMMCGQQIYIIQNEHGQFLKNSKSCSDLDKIFFVCLKAYEKKSKYDIFNILHLQIIRENE